MGKKCQLIVDLIFIPLIISQMELFICLYSIGISS